MGGFQSGKTADLLSASVFGYSYVDPLGLQASRVGNKALRTGGVPRLPAEVFPDAARLRLRQGIGGPFDETDAATSLSNAWATRRANQFNAAVRFLTRTPATDANLAKLQFELHCIGEQLAAHLPEDADALPRGYRAAKNGLGERAIAFDGVFFNPSYTAPAPDLALIERVAGDLKTGWLREVLEATGKVLDFKHAKAGLK
jgi:hypothetical protein